MQHTRKQPYSPSLPEAVFAQQQRFGHGACHDLSAALARRYGVPVTLLRGVNSGVIVHSVILLTDGYTLDAYGRRPLVTTLAHYGELTEDALGETVIVETVDADTFLTHYHDLDDSLDSEDEILADFSLITDYAGINIPLIFNGLALGVARDI